MELDYPYAAEYSKSGRASCKKCKEKIEKDQLRLASLVKSPFFDGRMANWHHFDCFFQRFRPKGIEDFKDFSSLKFDDQKCIEKKLLETIEPVENEKRKRQTGKKRKISLVNSNSGNDFTVEYSPSNRSGCRLCEEEIQKNLIRIGKMDFDSDNARRFGPFFRWFHAECFVRARNELEFFSSAQSLFKFTELSDDDQKKLSKSLPALESSNIKPLASKSVKKEKKPKKQEKSLKKQSDLLFEFIENLKRLRKQEIYELFQHNRIVAAPTDNSKRIEFLADALAFGLPSKCNQCSQGCLLFDSGRYQCTNHDSEWSRCTFTVEKPIRTPIAIPNELKKKYLFLKNYRFKKRSRLIDLELKNAIDRKLEQQLESVISESQNTSKAVDSDAHANHSNQPILHGYNFFLLTKKVSKKKIIELGGVVSKQVDRTVLAIISDEDSIKMKKSLQWKLIEQLQIPIVSEKFFQKLSSNPDDGIVKALLESKLVFWNYSDEENEFERRLVNLNVREKMRLIKSGNKGENLQSTKKLMVFKGGSVVDSESGLQDVAHVYKNKSDVYDAVLNLVDLSCNKNSFYKIQVLQDDKSSNKFWVFKSWGRIGTSVGNCKLAEFDDKNQAIEEFKNTYFKQTQNRWEDRERFRKKAGCYFPVETDYCEYDSKIDVATSTSQLPESVKNLIALIFDVQLMRQTMIEFELNISELPLGKLSRSRLLEACTCLKEISLVLKKNENLNDLIDPLTRICNRFYSLVPHSFGMNRPPLITSQETIAKKREMLESLMEIEFAYQIMNKKQEFDDGTDHDLIDCHYRKLDAKIEPIFEQEEEFKMIRKYIENTHAPTHDNYHLKILSVFRLQRSGEKKRFKPFAKTNNRMLLWHGSRLANWASIISQGLRIAPPEAPSTGYMFGKGVYFADAVSKSANYCFTTPDNNQGLLVLSEVALGESLVLKQARFIENLDKQYLSVKGVGNSQPDPSKSITIDKGSVTVPLGPLIANKKTENSDLLYNEYIVYDEKQILIRYLINVQFNYH